MSEGTWMSMDFSSDGLTVTRSPFFSMSAPMAAIIRSVWSRDSAGCITVVSPSAYSPAMRMHDLSWALATGMSYSIPLRPPPAERQWRERAAAPAHHPRSHQRERRQDSLHRASSQRRVSVTTLKNDCAARRPETSRIVVPLLPE